MSKRQKKKAPMVEGEPEVEIITKVEFIYEDTKASTGVEPDYKWGEIYRMIANCQNSIRFLCSRGSLSIPSTTLLFSR